MSDAALRQLAAAAGLCAEWEDVHGQTHAVPLDTLRVTLERLGLPCHGADDIAASRERLAQACEDRALYTGDVGNPVHGPPRLRSHARFEAVDVFGKSVEGRLTDGDGGRHLPPFAAPGEYRVEVEGRQFAVMIAPPSCLGVDDLLGTDARGWGTVAQLYALQRDRGATLGTYEDAATLAEALAAHGADALALSPTHAGFAARPTIFSPYSPSSRAFRQVLHVPPRAPAARAAPAGALIDWPAAARERLGLLRAEFETRSGDAGFAAFVRDGGDALMAHARFEAIDAHCTAQGCADWRDWPAPLQDAASDAVATFASHHADDVRWHLWLQWRADAALREAQSRARAAGMRIGLIADFAVGSHPGGSDTWRCPDQLLRGLQVGAPADLLAPEGQGWGLAALSPMAMRRDGFATWRAMLQSTMRHAGGVRIDHVMGLQRLWLVPDGALPREGVYLRYPVDDLLRLLAYESWTRRCLVVGEDLGTVDPALRRALAQRGVLGMDVLPFMQDDDGFLPASQWRRSAVAMTSTHDLAPVAGWWTARDLDERARLGAGDDAAARKQRATQRDALWSRLAGDAASAQPTPGEVVDAAVAFVGATPAPLALVPLEDLLGLDALPNLPGTDAEHPNWRRRMPRPVPTLLDGDAERRMARLADVRARPAAPAD